MKLSKVYSNLPSILKIHNARRIIKETNDKMGKKIVVLDDDPTGCQTVHNVKILLNWEESILKDTLENENIFYVLTNTRAYPEKKAVAITEEIIGRLLKYIDRSSLEVISRSDSTLRGHFFGEVKTLLDFLGPFDGIIVIPYFKEGGRFTIFDTHYVLQGDELIEVHNTEFSKDPVFSFKNSYLPAWIEEKSQGLWKREDVLSIKLEDIRLGGPEKIYEILRKVTDNRAIIVNSLSDEDLEVFVLGLLKAEAEGKRFLFRTAASFVKVRAGIEDGELLTSFNKKKGLIVVGSFVHRTTEQLSDFLNKFPLERVEIKISEILSERSFDYLRNIVEAINEALSSDKSIVVYTERNYAIPFEDREKRLSAGESISYFLADIVASLKEMPDFIIAKGGITSHIIAERGLKAKSAEVIGQIAPGVPVWRFTEDKFSDLLYVVFPGNVGDKTTLSRIYETLTKN